MANPLPLRANPTIAIFMDEEGILHAETFRNGARVKMTLREAEVGEKLLSELQRQWIEIRYNEEQQEERQRKIAQRREEARILREKEIARQRHVNVYMTSASTPGQGFEFADKVILGGDLSRRPRFVKTAMKEIEKQNQPPKRKKHNKVVNNEPVIDLCLED